MLKQEEIKSMGLQTPRYEFVEPVNPEAPELPPIRRQIAKIQVTADTFTLYEALSNIAQLDKMIADGEAKVASHKHARELFLAEMKIIEEALHVSNLQEKFQEEVAIENEKKAKEKIAADQEEEAHRAALNEKS